MQYHWNDVPSEIRIQVDKVIAGTRMVLGSEQVGLYLHGSLALGCFNPVRSDLDILVVAKHRTPRPVKQYLARLLLDQSNQPRPIELSLLGLDQLDTWRYPTPYDWHYSEDWRKLFEAGVMPSQFADGAPTPTDTDLAAHFMILHRAGIVLHGSPIAEVFPQVPPDDYRDSILRDAEEARLRLTANPVSNVLNLCRVYAYLQDAAVLSKDEGGEWALRQLPDEFQAVIRWALASYRGSDLDHTITGALDEALDRFAHYRPDGYPM